MSGKFTDEALKLWDEIPDTEKEVWTKDVQCQQCTAPIPADAYNGSIHEGHLALFHRCTKCGNEEVRTISPRFHDQQEIDDDFEAWAKAKRAENPDMFK